MTIWPNFDVAQGDKMESSSFSLEQEFRLKPYYSIRKLYISGCVCVCGMWYVRKGWVRCYIDLCVALKVSVGDWRVYTC